MLLDFLAKHFEHTQETWALYCFKWSPSWVHAISLIWSSRVYSVNRVLVLLLHAACLPSFLSSNMGETPSAGDAFDAFKASLTLVTLKEM